MKFNIYQKKGTTFIELLIYIGIFLVIMPVLLMVAINAARQDRQHVTEKQVNIDSQFVNKRIYDLVAQAKRVDVPDSVFESANGRLSLIMQDDTSVVIERNAATDQIEITEEGVTSSLSPDESVVDSLYFEKITDNLNDPDIVLGVTARLNIHSIDEYDEVQNYTTSASLENGDFDQDGCPDYKDKFPRHAQCCGDADSDGICNELDNCVLDYNPFQEDFDEDLIGDTCDSDVFLGENDGDGGVSAGTGGLGAFNCSTDEQLIGLIEQQPPLPSSQLKQILTSSSPLPPNVLMAVINNHPLLTNGHFRQVFVGNTKLTDEVYDAMVAMDLPFFHKLVIIGAQAAAEYIPWLGFDFQDRIEYDVLSAQSDCGEESTDNVVTFSNPSDALGGGSSSDKADVFIVNVSGANDEVEVTTNTNNGTAISVLIGGGDTLVDDLGFGITLESINGDNYAFTVTSVENQQALQSISFRFSCQSTVNGPTTSYETNRYTSYCEGGCVNSCGDTGTGILTDGIYTDVCYRWDWLFPEWCSKWYTFGDNDTENPAFLGGSTVGEERAYWEKTFKVILTQSQLSKLESLTVGGEIAYQSIAQFFCDTLNSSCPMDGGLIGDQDIELYNWETEDWESIGSMGLDGSLSDQQKYEVVYNGSNPQRFVGGEDNRLVRARMEFHWNGVAPEGYSTAAAFMLIDYFTLHLKW